MQLDLYDIFRTFSTENPDFNRSDARNDLELLLQRETMIEGFLRGQTPLDNVLDCLSDQGINPDDWIDVVVDNVEFVIDNGIQFVSNDKGLFLPRSLTE